ncbi:hypothetical protein [Algoriphagus yeomjeoni]|uniref:Uncharacterized protein n=1 Tax=Algoriphagus yeomjeoni TaxID=291403 RepID=A0A327PH27_9BACT|nr:hypothetical protein [Algoriphagus yeomjeoni]RAI91555.1 hypothetical protein LV83_01744 [Algoriphagus yeomjeoni]
MKRKLFLLIKLLIISPLGYAQINMEDSTVQVIAYWDLGEITSYSMVLENITVNGEDTTFHGTTSYLVDMEILDSTDVEYTVKWTYRDLQNSFGPGNESLEEVANRARDIEGGDVVIFKTNNLGTFKTLVNWEQIRDYYDKVREQLLVDFDTLPNVNQLVDSMYGANQTQSQVQLSSTKDVFQFLNYHGAKLRLNEPLTGKMKLPGLYDRGLVDGDFFVELEEIFEEDNDFRLVSFVEADAEQLVAQTRELLKAFIPDSSDDDIDTLMLQAGEITNTREDVTVMHGWGWPIYSQQVRRTTGNGVVNWEIRTIEIL